MEFINRIFILAQSLLDVSDTFFDFMLQEWNFGGGVYTTYDFLFGFGMVLVLWRLGLYTIRNIFPV